MTLIRFTEDRYLPFVEEHKRISTFRGYRNMWRRYLKPRCNIMLREFRTVDGERMLASIAKEHKLTSTTLAHIKASLRWAKKSRPSKSSIAHWNKRNDSTCAVSSLQRLTPNSVTTKKHLNPCSKASSSDQLEYRGSGWIPDSTLCEAIPDFWIS
jgi:hypothetical protein